MAARRPPPVSPPPPPPRAPYPRPSRPVHRRS